MFEYEEYFKKIVTFKCSGQYTLPNKVFDSSKWSISELYEKKQKLNDVKSLLNKFKLKLWSKHTAYRDPSSFVMKTLSNVIQPELLTQAWCKFYEILCQFPIIPKTAIQNAKLTSLHLCEAPGAFVCALNHFLVTTYPEIQWQWMANTLNPNYEGNELSKMIPDDRFLRYTMNNWHFGLDFTGDITKYYNHKEISSTYEKEKVLLVTADGSIDCMKDPGEQERHVEFLHFCETLTALTVLQKEGTFVLKIFTTFEDTTINLLYFLNCIFEEVSIFKPCTSKSGNSEVYVINQNFKGFNTLELIWPLLTSVYEDKRIFSSKAMFSLTDLPPSFLQEIHECTDFFMEKQIQTILNNIYTFEHKINGDTNKVYITKTNVAQFFMNYYRPKWIPNNKKIVPNVSVGNNWRVHPVQYSSNFDFVPVGNLIKTELSLNTLDLKIGKCIKTVQNSKFTHKDNLEKLTMVLGKTEQTTLYNQIVQYLDKNNEIINIKEFHTHVYYKFQKDFFFRLCNSLHFKNIIFVNIPFHTHFLVGLLYILFYAFKKVYFGKGIIILYQVINKNINIVKEIFSHIERKYKEIDENNIKFKDADYLLDIIQVIPSNLFDDTHSSLISLIWNYNQILSRNICAIKSNIYY